jgi:hypothetical protein
MEQPQMLISIILSLIALTISVTTLYLTHLRKALLRISAGEDVIISHTDAGLLWVNLPVSFENHGTRLGTVTRVALLVQNPGSKEGYLLEPIYFQGIDKNADFIFESLPTPIVVVGKGSITKTVLFASSSKTPGDFTLTKPGLYQMRLLAWSYHPEKPAVSYEFSIEISEENSKYLSDSLEKKENNFIRIPQYHWRQWAAHHLRESEVKTLLKKPA